MTKKLLLFTLSLLIFTLPAFAQRKDQPPTCGTPEINRAKALYRQASPQVRANAWLAQLLMVRADGKRTPEQLTSLNEVIPLISVDVFARKKALPADVKARAEKAFIDEKALVARLGTEAMLYVAKNIQLTPSLRPTVKVSFVPECECQFGYTNCFGGWGNPNWNTVCGKTSEYNLCSTTVEGCGLLWLSSCDGQCVQRPGSEEEQ